MVDYYLHDVQIHVAEISVQTKMLTEVLQINSAARPFYAADHRRATKRIIDLLEAHGKKMQKATAKLKEALG